MASPLPNHLVAHRKRAGLFQDEVAFLLGTRGGSKVSRYERFEREPNLEMVLAYEAMFGKPASTLFAGRYREIQKRVVERARVLLHKTKRQKPDKTNQIKLGTLAAIIARASKQP